MKNWETRKEWILPILQDNLNAVLEPYDSEEALNNFIESADGRVLVQTCLPLLKGNNEQVRMAERFLCSEEVERRLKNCSFTIEYMMALIHSVGDRIPEQILSDIRQRIKGGLHRYVTRDLCHHGYNDNHVTLATSSLILGGEWVGDGDAVEEGRANLLNFRDTLMRRGFMHETNDCYIPHTLYSTAAVAALAQDEECRELAKNCEARIWADWIGHYHFNLGRKPGPSARDYTMGRLYPYTTALTLWLVFGDEVLVPALRPDHLLTGHDPERYPFAFGVPEKGLFWNLGMISRFIAHDYHVPEVVLDRIRKPEYPHIIEGLHEVGHMDEEVSIRKFEPIPHRETKILEDVIPFGAREIHTVQVQEEDWAMGTASQRMIGNCPNNNWSVVWRKSRPMNHAREQNMLFCSYTINDKRASGDHEFEMLPDDPNAVNMEDMAHWFDIGRYAALQHGRTTMLLYRPRIAERHKITSLATSFFMPLCFGNTVDEIWIGDQRMDGFSGTSDELAPIVIHDGPVYIGLRPLLCRPQTCEHRIVLSSTENWGAIDVYGYQGEALSLTERELVRMGGGFICEVATEDDFDSVEAFQNWFKQVRVVDEQTLNMRQVRYAREGLSMGIRYDALNDQIMYRMLNGRNLVPPTFSCTGMPPESLPWLTGDVSGLDHIGWMERQAAREMNPQWAETGHFSRSEVNHG